MLNKIIDITMTIVSGLIVFGIFEYLRNIKSKDNDDNRKS